jgi:hypothetical protein
MLSMAADLLGDCKQVTNLSGTQSHPHENGS